MNPALECIRLPCSPIHQCPPSTIPGGDGGTRTRGTSRALLLSGQVLWPLSDVAVPLNGGRPGTRTPTTVSRLGRLATCCLTIRQAFRPFRMRWRWARDSNPRDLSVLPAFKAGSSTNRTPTVLSRGGGGGTRTLGPLARSPAFGAGALPLDYPSAYSLVAPRGLEPRTSWFRARRSPR